jgi:hypothetical protein
MHLLRGHIHSRARRCAMHTSVAASRPVQPCVDGQGAIALSISLSPSSPPSFSGTRAPAAVRPATPPAAAAAMPGPRVGTVARVRVVRGVAVVVAMVVGRGRGALAGLHRAVVGCARGAAAQDSVSLADELEDCVGVGPAGALVRVIPQSQLVVGLWVVRAPSGNARRKQSSERGGGGRQGRERDRVGGSGGTALLCWSPS